MSEQTDWKREWLKVSDENAALRERVEELEGLCQRVLDSRILNLHEHAAQLRGDLFAALAARTLADGPHDHDHLDGKE